MVNNLKNDFLLQLASTCIGNRVKTASLKKAFEQICKEADLDYGMVYERELSNEFSLFEKYLTKESQILNPINMAELATILLDFIKEKTFVYITRENACESVEQHLLNLYDALSIVIAPIFEEDGSIYGIILFVNTTSNRVYSEAEISVMSIACSIVVHYMEKRMYQRRLVQAQMTMESILDNTGIDIYVNDFYTHEILYVNKSMAAPYGGQSQFMGQKCWKTLFPGQQGPCEFCPQKNIIDDNGMPTKVYTWDYQRPFDGSWFRVFSSAFKWIDGRLAHVVSSADITDNKRNEALVENLANYDQLTKLPNRRMLMKECERRINNATTEEKGYVLFFDIDRFKPINDLLGHDAGDEFLIQLGEFFASIPLLKDSIYRNGGDEFVAVIGGENVTKKNIQSLSSFILERFKKPWKLKKGDVLCSTSIGVACFPEDGTSVDTLLQKADMAMYKVKKSGGGNLCFAYQLQE